MHCQIDKYCGNKLQAWKNVCIIIIVHAVKVLKKIPTARANKTYVIVMIGHFYICRKLDLILYDT